MKITKYKSRSSILILGIILTGMLITNVSYGQKSVIKTNLANLAISGGSAHYEHALNDASSVQVGVFISSLGIDQTSFSGFGIIPQYRFYLGSNEIPHGFYFAPLLSYQNFSLETDVSSSSQRAKATYSLIGGGADIGKQWLINRAFSIELSIGATFNATSLSIKTDNVNEQEFSTGGLGSVAPRLGISLGYAF